MIYVDSISQALFTAIASDAAIVNSGTTVWLERERNTDAGFTPWIGVYYVGTQIEPKRANVSAPFEARHTFRLECQAFNGVDLLAARMQSYQVLWQVLTAVNTARASTGVVLGGAVDMFMDAQVNQPDTVPNTDGGGFSTVEANLMFEQRA